MPIMLNLLVAAELDWDGEPSIYCVDHRCAHVGRQGKLFGRETVSATILMSAIENHDREYNQ